MALETYRAKRRFGATSEPRGRKAKAGGRAFVIQKHAARRLHYDLRLELDGVMKSWAVTRGPSLVPGDKRLAVHVEDHPVEYNTFEGTIPKGEYGGGTVMIWDRGTWTPEGDPHKGYKKGHLEFSLDGEKLQGRWHLVRMHKRAGERQDPWLLIKSEDEVARASGEADILDELPRSAASGRTMDEITAGRPVRKKSARGVVPATATWSSAKKTLVTPPPAVDMHSAPPAGRAAKSRLGRAAPLPDFVPPCLACAQDHPPDTAEWIHEIKFDGYRMQARLEGGEVELKTRTGLDWSDKFPNVVDALRALPVDQALIDGEIVVETDAGIPSFGALQEELKNGGKRFVFYVFDLLHRDGRDVTQCPLIERKQALRELVEPMAPHGVVRLSEHFDTKGSVLLDHACRMMLEGIVSKRRDAAYRSGRTGDWTKTKCSGRQEFVVIGFATATNDARAVGSLILGYYDNDALRYAGRVGTGFTRATARDLWKRLQPLRRKSAPLKPVPEEERGRKAAWVEPRLVAEVDFSGWTQALRVRHASFVGLREDKAARQVVREIPVMTTKVERNAPPAARGKSKADGAHSTPANGSIVLTHPDRVYWEDVGLTKQGLADYYADIWEWIAPQVVGRALSLVRCPKGIAKHCFFQKHASSGLDATHLNLVPEDGDQIIAIDSLDGLLSLVQSGVLEIHVRGSMVDRLDAADRLVFDLDPAPGVEWTDVVTAARDVRERLQALGLNSYLKTTGGKGLHVVAPIEPAPWQEVKTFTRGVAFAMQADSPDRYVATASKEKRAGRVFVDYLRNSREATAICAYSTRARPGATVATPIHWREVGSLDAPNHYTVANLARRLQRMKQDPWADIARERQRLPNTSRKPR